MGARIKECRTALGLTLDQVAKRIGMTHPSVSGWENGKVATMKADSFMRLCDVLQVRPIWLWTGKGVRNRELSTEARELGQLYDTLPRPMQLQLLATVEALARMQDAEAIPPSQIHQLRVLPHKD